VAGHSGWGVGKKEKNEGVGPRVCGGVHHAVDGLVHRRPTPPRTLLPLLGGTLEGKTQLLWRFSCMRACVHLHIRARTVRNNQVVVGNVGSISINVPLRSLRSKPCEVVVSDVTAVVVCSTDAVSLPCTWLSGDVTPHWCFCFRGCVGRGR
jgi:hypothetical protein